MPIYWHEAANKRPPKNGTYLGWWKNHLDCKRPRAFNILEYTMSEGWHRGLFNDLPPPDYWSALNKPIENPPI